MMAYVTNENKWLMKQMVNFISSAINLYSIYLNKF